MDILPDSRTQKSSVGINRGVAGTWLPIFCANCGVCGGQCPEENMTFLFYLCAACATTYGDIAGTMLMPDEVFFQRLAEEQLEQYGHYLSEAEWNVVLENPLLPITKLFFEHTKGT